jgi:manganese transport protein
LAYVAAAPVFPALRALGTGTPAGVHQPPEALRLALAEVASARPFSKVAVALDFSGRDNLLLQETLRLIGDQRPELALMHVTESAAARFLGEEADDVESQRDSERLESYAAELRKLGFLVAPQLGRGRPVEELSRLVEEFGAEVVVLGAHGHGFFKDLLYGSTADALRHRIRASVFVVGRGR